MGDQSSVVRVHNSQPNNFWKQLYILYYMKIFLVRVEDVLLRGVAKGHVVLSFARLDSLPSGLGRAIALHAPRHLQLYLCCV
jgi:hypothetical protein